MQELSHFSHSPQTCYAMFFFKSSILVQKTEQLYALGHAAPTRMRWGTLLLGVCVVARYCYSYALGHASPRRMRWGTMLLGVCGGARCSEAYALGHDVSSCMRWVFLLLGVCFGPCACFSWFCISLLGTRHCTVAEHRRQ